MRLHIVIAIVPVLLVPVVILTATIRHDATRVPRDDATNRPVEVDSHGYVGSDTCRTCHPQEHATWHASYHRTMTQVASEDSVVGRFQGSLVLDGRAYHFAERDGEFLVDMPIPEGARAENDPDHSAADRFVRPIVMTTGSHHMQVYWFPVNDDSSFLGMLPFVYLIDEQRWIPRDASFLKPPQPESDEAGRWNEECIRCHATHGRMGAELDQQEESYDYRDINTRVAELGIACEACHGPGEAHVLANRSPLHRYRQHWNGAADGTIVHPGQLSHELSSQVCGQCHGIFQMHDMDAISRWMQSGWAYRPGDDLNASDLRYLQQCTAGWGPDEESTFQHQFWRDGMVRVSGREYNGLVESPCFQRGELSCLHCHQMHQSRSDPRPVEEWADDQLHAGMHANAACTQCHQEYRDESTLVGHTRHPADSSGSNCYNCHMPYTTYGLLKAIRSHQISVPSVQESLETGRPNACNQCHLDQTLAWSAGYLSEWYDVPEPELTEEEQTIAASVLWLLRGDAGQRALMAWSLGWEEAREVSGTDWMPPYLAILMQEPYAAVRHIAARSLKKLPEYRFLDYDYVGGEQHVTAVSADVLHFWEEQHDALETDRARRLLLDESGNLNGDELVRLLEQRDQRPVDLHE